MNEIYELIIKNIVFYCYKEKQYKDYLLKLYNSNSWLNRIETQLNISRNEFSIINKYFKSLGLIKERKNNGTYTQYKITEEGKFVANKLKLLEKVKGGS